MLENGMQELREIIELSCVSHTPKGCIYSHNIKFARWNSNRTVGIQTGLLDIELERLDLF